MSKASIARIFSGTGDVSHIKQLLGSIERERADLAQQVVICALFPAFDTVYDSVWYWKAGRRASQRTRQPDNSRPPRKSRWHTAVLTPIEPSNDRT